MQKPITHDLDAIPELNKMALHQLWRQVFETAPSPKLRKDLMVPMLVYRIQERAFTSVKSKSRDRLRQLSRAFETDSRSAILSVPGIKPGTRLVRKWRGQVHLVNVEENGYEYQCGRYQSLSEIARLITGTRWSGPLFFGTKAAQGKSKSKEVE